MAEFSYKKAVAAMCKQCLYDPHAEGTWVQQVRNCTDTKCPLYPYRPGVRKSRKKVKASS